MGREGVSDFYWLKPTHVSSCALCVPGPRYLFRTTRSLGRHRPWLAPPVADISLRCAWNTNAPSIRSVVSKRTDGELSTHYSPSTDPRIFWHWSPGLIHPVYYLALPRNFSNRVFRQYSSHTPILVPHGQIKDRLTVDKELRKLKSEMFSIRHELIDVYR